MNVRPKAIKLLEENIGGELLGISLGDDLTPKAKAAKAKKNKWDYIELTSLCLANETIHKLEGNLPNRRKCLQVIYLIRG